MCMKVCIQIRVQNLCVSGGASNIRRVSVCTSFICLKDVVKDILWLGFGVKDAMKDAPNACLA